MSGLSSIFQSQEKNGMIRIAAVADDQIVRTGIRGLLKKAARNKIIADAGGWEKGVDLLRWLLRGEDVVMDIQMPRIFGFKAFRS